MQRQTPEQIAAQVLEILQEHPDASVKVITACGDPDAGTWEFNVPDCGPVIFDPSAAIPIPAKD